ncbi:MULTISPECIES: DMT family transporter [Vibrio]|uniref:DMT family transporter n=1 Tax=Vibrio TaxID=662 RepID=UPI0020755909|nr:MULTISPECIES: DMT family transporter [Vibrio]USD34371.1 DMT family transporter [Vibrio sp. SCSIO 43186]USD47442.1 DMT family transporter [Vibrio sp. SCSIO 43145]USD71496.1 DMT family transporter [Vibrio sp. SCSIO 43139]USD98402.1 EamA family transporter [Vibrio coralliilyticus]
MLVKLIPFVFVVLWASGFVGARFGLQYAEPATLLTLRMLANVGFFWLLVTLLRRSIPKGKLFWHSCMVGVLIHGFYLGGTYIAIKLGMPAGLSSLLVGIQPILTAVLLVVFQREYFKLSQWFGLALGFVGISLVLIGKTQWQDETHKVVAIGLCILSLVGITLGTLYQKRFCQGVDMVGSALIQYLAAGCVFLPYAMSFETMQVNWTLEFVLTLGWLVVVLSCVAILLLLYMVENGASSKVASVFYLVPPMTAIQAWFIFDESFDRLAMLGFALAALAVYLVVKVPKHQCPSKPRSNMATSNS